MKKKIVTLENLILNKKYILNKDYIIIIQKEKDEINKLRFQNFKKLNLKKNIHFQNKIRKEKTLFMSKISKIDSLLNLEHENKINKIKSFFFLNPIDSIKIKDLNWLNSFENLNSTILSSIKVLMNIKISLKE